MFWLGIKTQLLPPLAAFNILKNLSYSKIHLGHNVIVGVVLSIEVPIFISCCSFYQNYLITFVQRVVTDHNISSFLGAFTIV